MDQHAAIHRVRIGVSVFFVVLAVLFGVMWLRSLWRSDRIVWSYSAGRFVMLQSVDGHLFLNVEKSGSIPARDPKTFLFRSRTPSHEDLALPKIDLMHAGFGYYYSDDFKFLAAPYWFFLLVTCIAGVVAGRPYIAYRFSLRTMLIVTTLVAILLGLGVWLAG